MALHFVDAAAQLGELSAHGRAGFGVEVPQQHADQDGRDDLKVQRLVEGLGAAGRGVFGVEAASEYYFNKNAKDLTKSEAAWIAAILPNPKKYDPKNPSAYLKRKHSWIMRQMNNVNLK